MSEPTVQLSLDDHLLRMARTADTLRAHLSGLRRELEAQGRSLPPGVVQGLRQLSGTLLAAREQAADLLRERRNLLALSDIAGAINSSLDLTMVLNQVMDTIIRLTGAERAFLMLRDEDGEMQVLAARNWEHQSLPAHEVEISQTVVQRALTRGTAILTTNAQADPRFEARESVVAFNLRSILCVPLKVKDEITGVIYADNRAREGLFAERERDLLIGFANQAGVALENARLYDSVRRTLAEVTELKGLMDDVFASIASGVITADVEAQITLCNHAAQQILGWTEDEMIGRRLSALAEVLSPDLERMVSKAMQGRERLLGYEIHPVLKGRGAVDLSLNITPIKTLGEAVRGVAIVVDDLTEKRRLEAQRRLFELMVSPRVIAQIDPNRFQLGGKREHITTLFADIRGFTRFSEATDPETLVEVLNRYLGLAVETILAQEGTIDKFLGDAVMAWFNHPVEQPDHARRALRAALDLRTVTQALHDELPRDTHLSIGIGIHSGEAVLGLVGAKRRLSYTAIGDSVNTAKRLQENAEEWQILVSRATLAEAGAGVEARPVAPIEAHGKQNPIEALELIAIK